jgi:hypothetical protein
MYVAVQLENDLLSAGARKLLLFTKLIPYRVQHAPEGLGDLAKRLTWHGINTTTRIGANDSHRTLASCCWEQRPSSALICSYSAASATSRCARRSSAASRPHWSGTQTVRYSWFTKELADFLSDLWIDHLVRSLNGRDPGSKPFRLEPLFQFAFGLAWAEDEQRSRFGHRGDNGVVVTVPLPGEGCCRLSSAGTARDS